MKRERPVFELLSPDQTGIRFTNTITTTDSENVLTNRYIYNGAGVAVGDIDNDGLPDIFFAGNMVSSRLYHNKGSFKFEDITDRAGVKTKTWASGATMVDINNDGYLDIYVSVSGPPDSKATDRANLLFINNRNGTFTEAAARYGIADTGFTTQAAFFDYNGDGCLDLFLLNNSPHDFSRGVANQPGAQRPTTPGSHNVLYRNSCNGTFTDVTAEAGINEIGFGLGVVIADVNGDGRPDIYISNDIQPNDVLYINNGDGTFTNAAAAALKHTSFSGMGVDIADFNDDGWPDIAQVEMLARDPGRRKRTTGFLTYSGLLASRRQGFRDDYSLNSLQLNNGVDAKGNPVFSEISRLAGISATDWSWSVLFADFDNDGRKDIFVSNGYPKGVIDLDYQNAMLSAIRSRAASSGRRVRELLAQLPGYQEGNFVFRNNGDLTFTDESEAWGVKKPAGYSYGAAYADLDNSGRLDLVVSNIDGPAFVYRNAVPDDDAHNWLRVKLDGDPPNVGGIGASLMLSAGGRRQFLYHSPYRGYLSTVDSREHFGLGAATRVDTLEVTWPDGRRQFLTGLPVNREIVVRHADASVLEHPAQAVARRRQMFERVAVPGLGYQQQLSGMVDYSIQGLLPYMVSRHGPVLAVGDVNGDGLEDLFIGGGNGAPGRLFLQRHDGTFVESSAGQPWEADKAYEDWGAVFFDANGDGLPDLYVTSGGYQLIADSPLLQDRLYLNKGGGHFERDTSALPPMRTSKGVVRVADYNGDGRPDLFVAGRLTPRNWPTPTRSYILRNDGGHFTDVTAQVAPELVQPGGMITDALWIDFDGDGKLDLVTAGEWMPIKFHRNDGKRFVDVTRDTHLPATRGWWYSLAAGDFDHDGRPDIIAGNLGLNLFSTSAKSKFGVYEGDFAGNRSMDVVLTQELGGTEYPIAGLARLGPTIYTLPIRYPNYSSFANASMNDAFGPTLHNALHLQADTFASVYLHNEGRGTFTMTALPTRAQIAPIKGIVVRDIDGDGNLDIVVAGNLYDVEANTAPADAGRGLWLKGDGKGHFTPVAPMESGLFAPWNVSGLTVLSTVHGAVLLVPNVGDSLQAFAITRALNTAPQAK